MKKPSIIIRNMLLFLIMLICVNESIAQSFTVIISDNISKQPLPAASVTIRGKNMPGIVLTTNNKGVASIANHMEGTYTLSVSYVGYHSIDTTVLLPQQNKLLCLLSPDISTLKEVKTVARKPYIVMSRGKMIMNVSESALAGSGNAWDALKYAPTVESSLTGKLTVRAQEATVFLDGRRIYLRGDELMQYLQTINGAEIDQIEIIHHPGPSYPSDVQTVISIKTKKLRSRGVRNTLMLAGVQGIYPRYNITDRVDISTKRLDMQAGYTFTHLKKATTTYYNTLQNGEFPWNITQFNKATQDNQKVYANMAIRLRDESLLSFYGELSANKNSANTYSENGAPTADRIAKNDSVYRYNARLHNSTQLPFVQVSYDKKWDSSRQSIKLQSEFFYNNRKYNNTYQISSYKDTAFVQDKYLKDSLPQRLKTFVQSAGYTNQILHGELTSGARYSYTTLDNNNKTTTLPSMAVVSTANLVYKERNYALFTTWAKESKRFYYEAGVRYENNKVNAKNNGIYDTASPSIAALLPSGLIQWQLSDVHAMVLSYKKSIVKPDYFQLNSYARFTDNSSTIFKGNQSIRPQINHTIDLTWQYASSLNVSAGAQLIKDYISVLYLLDESKNLYQQYSNFQKANLYYLNISWSSSITKWWLMNVNMSSFLADVRYNSIHGKGATPSLYASFINSFSLPGGVKIESAFNGNNAFSDGFFKHAANGSADIAIRKQVPSANLTISLSGSTTVGPNSYSKAVYSNITYMDKAYYDAKFVRLILTWTFGKQSIKTIKKQTSASEDDQKRIKEKI